MTKATFGRAPRLALLAVLLVVLGSSLFSFVASQARLGHPGPLTDPTDFVAFYCGGAVLAERRDPYRSEPLRSCQVAAFAESRIAMIPHLVVPAPLPPYALAFFSAFSVVPFRAACVAFLFVSVGLIGASIALSYRLARINLAFLAGTTIVALTVGSLYIGQIVPIVVAALCASAVSLRANRVREATAFAVVTMLEPHLGLPVLLALVVLEPRARVPAIAGALGLAAFSLAVGGVALNREYAFAVLPAHALSEVGNFGGQYSLTALLAELGTPAAIAVRAGELSYVVMVVAGIALAGRLRRAFDDRAFVVLAPPACALLGGVFIHIHQMAIALPLAYLLLSRLEPSRARAFAYVATAILAVPWQSIFETALGPFFPPHVHVDFVKTLAVVSDGRLLADTAWQAWVGLLGARDGRTPFEKLLFKLPTWFGLVSLLVVAIRVRVAEPAPAPRPGMESPRARSIATG